MFVGEKSLIDVLKDKYYDLSDEEKNEYVVKTFCESIDKNSNLDLETKEDIKGVSSFLSDWGYLYDIDDLIDLETNSLLLSVNNNSDTNSVSKLISADYEPINNVVTIYGDSVDSKLQHEAVHSITHPYNYNSFVDESIVASIEQSYFDSSNSYYDVMKSQVLFLGEIVGRENLLKSFVSGDQKYLEDLIMKCSSKEDCDKLLKLFNEEIYFVRYGIIMKDYFEQSNELLKKMYENKYNKKINEDAIVYAIYNASFVDSNYKLSSTIFYKEDFYFGVLDEYGNISSFDISVYDRDNTIYDVYDYFNIDISNNKRTR